MFKEIFEEIKRHFEKPEPIKIYKVKFLNLANNEIEEFEKMDSLGIANVLCHGFDIIEMEEVK